MSSAGMHALAALALAAVAGGCALPPDHAFTQLMGKSLSKFDHGIRTTGELIGGETRRLSSVTSGLESLGGAEVHRLGDLDRGSRELVVLETGRLAALPARTEAVVGPESRRAVRGLGRLSDPDVLLLSPNGARANLNRRFAALKRAPSTLGLDRQLWPEPTDPERTIEIDPTVRQPSWIERILHRIPRL